MKHNFLLNNVNFGQKKEKVSVRGKSQIEFNNENELFSDHKNPRKSQLIDIGLNLAEKSSV